MENTDIVKYKWNNGDKDSDLVCELTKFMDQYIKDKDMLKYCQTYIYNDIGVFSTENLLQIAFRYPGATRGGILLKRLDTNKFEIIGFHFNQDVSFSDEFGCYKKELQNDIDQWVGKILDFSNVTLVNKYAEFTY